MKRIRSILYLFIFLSFISCKKSSDNKDSVQGGTEVNTWTFKEGSSKFWGHLLFDGELNTLLQSNNSYTFGIIGSEDNSGYVFNVVLSLLDLNFTQKTYQSGVDGNDYLNAFYYTVSPGAADNIYKSSIMTRDRL
jgi:hypothetical protein